MNIPTPEQIKNTTNDIYKLLLGTPNEVELRCNDGAIVINPDTMNFTYIGKWGNLVLNTMINMKVINDDAKKLRLLSEMITLYSMNNGGFNYITIL